MTVEAHVLANALKINKKTVHCEKYVEAKVEKKKRNKFTVICLEEKKFKFE